MIKYKHTGDSPSGKAVGSGPTIRGFESLIPSQENCSNQIRRENAKHFLRIRKKLKI